MFDTASDVEWPVRIVRTVINTVGVTISIPSDTLRGVLAEIERERWHDAVDMDRVDDVDRLHLDRAGRTRPAAVASQLQLLVDPGG